ncbi:MAG: hypothetical protein ACP5E3_08015 [Bacteroidales bacterium]
MKKVIILIIAFIIFANYAYNQDQKTFTANKFMVGGVVNVDAGKVDNIENGNSYRIDYEGKLSSDIRLGFLIFDNIAAGISRDFSFYRHKLQDGSTTNIDMLLFEPFIRFYAPFGMFIDGSLGYGFYKSNFDGVAIDDEIKKAWSLGIGYDYFITEHIALESVISYDVIKNSDRSDVFTVKKNGLSLNIGVVLYLDLFKSNN